MFEKIYKNSIIEKPKFTLLILFILLLSFGYFSKNFQLDASSDTLVAQNDEDFEYFNKFGKLKIRCSSDAKIFFNEKSFDEDWAVENLKDTDVAIIIHRHLFSKKLADAVNKVNKKILELSSNEKNYDKGEYKNFMAKEIDEQPVTIKNCINEYLDKKKILRSIEFVLK